MGDFYVAFCKGFEGENETQPVHCQSSTSLPKIQQHYKFPIILRKH